MIQEDKYIVIKRDDVYRYLLASEQTILTKILRRIAQERLNEGKKLNSYFVVNRDEDYANAVWDLINHKNDGFRKL